MNRLIFAGAALLAAATLPNAANAQGSVKIGVISAFSSISSRSMTSTRSG